MREAIKAALAILAASAILWAVEPARAEVQRLRRPVDRCSMGCRIFIENPPPFKQAPAGRGVLSSPSR